MNELKLPEPDTHCLDDEGGRPIDVWSYLPELVRLIIAADRALQDTRHAEELAAYELTVSNLKAQRVSAEWDASVQKAHDDAMIVFKDSCNHTHMAIDYMKSLLHYTYQPAAPAQPAPPAQPERKPMTYEQLAEIGDRVQPHEWSSAFARAIEAFHGIKVRRYETR